MTYLPAPIARIIAVLFWPIIILMIVVCMIGVKLFQLITTLRRLTGEECLRILGKTFSGPSHDRA